MSSETPLTDAAFKRATYFVDDELRPVKRKEYDCGKLLADMRDMETRLRQAEADLVKAREDAERYRWLRINAYKLGIQFQLKNAEELDAAIDRAMKGKPT